MLELGRRLRGFRDRYALTQTEVAAVVGANDKSGVSQWEMGVTGPDGARRERFVELLEGRLWPLPRVAVVAGAGLPERWAEAVRWYRWASRERGARLGVAVALNDVLQVLREVDSLDGLREWYRATTGEWASRLAPNCKANALSARTGKYTLTRELPPRRAFRRSSPHVPHLRSESFSSCQFGLAGRGVDDDPVINAATLGRDLAVSNVGGDAGRVALERVAVAASAGQRVAEQIALAKSEVLLGR